MRWFDLYPHRLSIYPPSSLPSLLWLAASLRQVCDRTGVSSLNSLSAGEKLQHVCECVFFWGGGNSLTPHIKDWESAATGVKCILFGIRNQRRRWKKMVLTCKLKVVSFSQSPIEWKREVLAAWFLWPFPIILLYFLFCFIFYFTVFFLHDHSHNEVIIIYVHLITLPLHTILSQNNYDYVYHA